MDSDHSGTIREPGTRYKYKISRRGRKLNYCDNKVLLSVLPKDVPENLWFPGKLEFPESSKEPSDPVVIEIDEKADEVSPQASASTMRISSEILERVTDYNKHLVSVQASTTDVPSIDDGGGDMAADRRDRKKINAPKKKEKPAEQNKTRSQKTLPPLKLASRNDIGRSRMSRISAAAGSEMHSCRSLRMETTYSVGSEKLESLEDLTKNRSSKKK